jgi:hypothetical protein
LQPVPLIQLKFRQDILVTTHTQFAGMGRHLFLMDTMAFSAVHGRFGMRPGQVLTGAVLVARQALFGFFQCGFIFKCHNGTGCSFFGVLGPFTVAVGATGPHGIVEVAFESGCQVFMTFGTDAGFTGIFTGCRSGCSCQGSCHSHHTNGENQDS